MKLWNITSHRFTFNWALVCFGDKVQVAPSLSYLFLSSVLRGGGGGGEGDLILHTIMSGKLYLKVSPGTDSCYISRLSPLSLSKQIYLLKLNYNLKIELTGPTHNSRRNMQVR